MGIIRPTMGMYVFPVVYLRQSIRRMVLIVKNGVVIVTYREQEVVSLTK